MSQSAYGSTVAVGKAWREPVSKTISQSPRPEVERSIAEGRKRNRTKPSRSDKAFGGVGLAGLTAAGGGTAYAGLASSKQRHLERESAAGAKKLIATNSAHTAAVSDLQRATAARNSAKLYSEHRQKKLSDFHRWAAGAKEGQKYTGGTINGAKYQVEHRVRPHQGTKRLLNHMEAKATTADLQLREAKRAFDQGQKAASTAEAANRDAAGSAVRRARRVAENKPRALKAMKLGRRTAVGGGLAALGAAAGYERSRSARA